MATIQTYNFKNHTKGDTFKGVSFTITIDTLDSLGVVTSSTPLNLTDASIKMSLKTSKNNSRSDLDLTTVNGKILITTPLEGKFQVARQIISISAQLYYYDIQITLADLSVHTYIEGQWKIIQDITL